ncbi:hypothetical protein KRP22_007477 [Phytophthora ramorum]|uniref:Uncharacterized protein n=1 Tax=Phytophthora ramorum TaxID=164328 RepID=H3HCG1_PHYRM|nr:hypothetical protein KRP22_4511 [Phytophthora ramorum]
MARSSVASLLEENRQLRVQLERSDLARRRVEGQVTEMQRRVSFAETTAAQQLRLKEGEWMAEYDRSVQALLMIIKHHEEEMARVEMEVQQLRAAAGDIPSPTTKMTRSTQTEVLRPTTSRRNSVRFAEEEDGTTLEKEERAYIDAKAKSNLVRMQVSCAGGRAAESTTSDEMCACFTDAAVI